MLQFKTQPVNISMESPVVNIIISVTHEVMYGMISLVSLYES